MIPIKKIFRFFVAFIILYFLFVQAFQFLSMQETAGRLFINSTQSVVSTFLPKAFIEMTPPPKKDRSAYKYVLDISYASKAYFKQEVRMAAAQGRTTTEIKTVHVTFNCFVLVFVPLSFLFSLIISTCSNWKEGLKSVLFGLGIFLCFYYARMVLYLLNSIALNPIGVYNWTKGCARFLSTLNKVFELGGTLVVALIIWTALSFRKRIFFFGLNN